MKTTKNKKLVTWNNYETYSMELFHLKELRDLLQEELLKMLAGRIHVVVYFKIVVYLHLFRCKELRDLLQDELLEMVVGSTHVVPYFVTVVYLHLYLDFASQQRLL